jgi:hypothetical protein
MRSSLLTLSIVLLLCSCGEDHHHDHGDLDAASVPGLTLNDGKKWQMDDHTREMFAAMATRTSEHKGELKKLGEGLEEDLDKLVRGCTMVGGAHDELHRFLIHYVPAVSKLENTGSMEALTRVKMLLQAYPEYFE